MSLRMEQTLSEVISLESAPLHTDAASQSERRYISQASSVNGYSGNVTFSETGKHSWAFEMQIWLLIVDLFLKLDQVRCLARVCLPYFLIVCHLTGERSGNLRQRRSRLGVWLFVAPVDVHQGSHQQEAWPMVRRQDSLSECHLD